MKNILEKIRQFNKNSGKKGAALITVIYITSIALVLVISLSALASYSLGNSINVIKEDQALYNAESIAKMISDDITSPTEKERYDSILGNLSSKEEIVCQLNNDKMGQTTVTFKKETNRINNVVMTVVTNYKDQQGVVKVRFRMSPEGDSSAVTQEVTKIFENTVYSGAFPSGLAGSLNYVDFAGDIVLKLDSNKSLGTNDEGNQPGINFGGAVPVTLDNLFGRKKHEGNLIIIFEDILEDATPNQRPTAVLAGSTAINGNIITNGNLDLRISSKVAGAIIAEGNINIASSSGGGSFDSIGKEAPGGVAMVSGGKILANYSIKGINEAIKDKDFKGIKVGCIFGDIYAAEGFTSKFHLYTTGKLFVGKKSDTINFNELTVIGKTLLATTWWPISKTAVEWGVYYGVIFTEHLVNGKTTIKQYAKEQLEVFFTTEPNPLWYAPDDGFPLEDVDNKDNPGLKRNDEQSGAPVEKYHNFSAYVDNEGINQRIQAKVIDAYTEDVVRALQSGTNIEPGYKSWTLSDNTTKIVKVINKSGCVNQITVDNAINPIKQGSSANGTILSSYHKTVVLDTTGGDLHLKLTSNIIFDDTDVIVIGNNFVYFYTEQYRIDVGSNKKDNRCDDAFNDQGHPNNNIDRYIHFGVKAEKDSTGDYKRKYNVQYKNVKDLDLPNILEGHITTEWNEFFPDKTLIRPQIFVTSSYGETEEKTKVSAVDHAGNLSATQEADFKKQKTINPFMCINNNACAYAYLYAPYRPVVMSESYWKEKAKLSTDEEATALINSKTFEDEKEGIYKFMGSLCVNRIDDYIDAYSKTSGSTNMYKYGINLFRKIRSDGFSQDNVPVRKLYYLNPADAKGAFSGIIFNRESLLYLKPDASIPSEEDKKEWLNPTEAQWSIEAFL